jgi:hypothetical protein
MHACWPRLLLFVGLLASCAESTASAQSSGAAAGVGRPAVKSTAQAGGAPAAGSQKLPNKPPSAANSGQSITPGPTASVANLPGSSPPIFSALEALSKASNNSRQSATIPPTGANVPPASAGNQSGNTSPVTALPRLPAQRIPQQQQNNSIGGRRSSSSRPLIDALLNRRRSGPGNGPRRGFRRSA